MAGQGGGDGEDWQAIMGGAYQLVALRRHLEDDEKEAFVRAKEKELGGLLDFCRAHGCEKSAAYLEKAAGFVHGSAEQPAWQKHQPELKG